ncbi:MAG: hypothetical protein MOB07_14020 [Acidobacteria bacterium]|nr:hypothetical protein [Acidobacteriota bacterium]
MNQNGHSEIHQNGHGLTTGVVTESSPYYTLRRRPGHTEGEDTEAKEAEQRSVEAEDENALDETEPNSNRKKRLAFAAFLLLVVAGLGTVLYLKFGYTTKIDYQVKAKRPGGIIQQGQQGQQLLGEESSDQQTEAAIAQAKEARRAGDEAGINPAEGSSATARANPTIETALPALPRLSVSGEYVEPRAARGSAGGIGADGGNPAGGEQSGAARARNRTAGQPRHSASSVYVGAGETAKASSGGMSGALPAARPSTSLLRSERQITLPTFGTMLPVRTLGGIYTLRNSLARLELTRDIAGDGWALKKGTVLIAQQQGGAFDRAYLSISGFIDPATNRFVKVTGEVLGSDGAPGMKGKRRQISSRWSRAFNRVLNIAPGIAQAALARNGGTTVIVPAGGASDLIGQGGFNLDRREFVEIEAGSSGYVMITDLPDTTKSRDADPDLAADGEGALSDEELAKLLSEGTPAQIKAAMPRMNPEMRRVAALAIGEAKE